MNGIDRFYWYAWDNPNWGTLYAGSIDPAGTAYGLLEGWLVGSSHGSDPCSEDKASTWTCSLVLAGGAQALIVWNPSAPESVSIAAPYAHYRTLDDATVQAITGGSVTADLKPILITP
jgi:hypothetical protein